MWKKPVGFTLLELLSIILLLGIVSVVVFSRLDSNTFRTAGFEQELRSALRFAQKFAIVSGCEVEVDISAAGYALRVRDNAAAGCPNPLGDPLNNPTGGTFTGVPPAGVAVTGLNFFYNGRGIPVDGGGNPVADGTIMFGGQPTIVVEAVTGYVH